MALSRKLREDLAPPNSGSHVPRPGESGRAPRHTIPNVEMAPDTAFQFVPTS